MAPLIRGRRLPERRLENGILDSYNAEVMSTSTDPAAPIEDTIAIVGVGLIGGSIAAAAKSRRVARSVIGVGRNPERLQIARSRGLVDDVSDDLATVAAQSNLIIFCTPVDRIVEGVKFAAAASRPGTLITDAGSVKRKICDALRDSLAPGVEFIGSHPLAGSEKQGFEFATADLLEDRVCVVTPSEQSSTAARGRASRFWRALGASVVEMSPEEHDRALAETSHFPHLAAAALAATLSDSYRALAASGFRDTTRVAAGDPRLWTQILLDNRVDVLTSLEKFSQTLDAFRQAIGTQDAAGVLRLLENGKRIRDSL